MLRTPLMRRQLDGGSNESKADMATGSRKLELAKRHLDRVLGAWTEPTDWDDLSLYGFYCLEAAVEAAALHFGLRTSRKHWEKVDLAEDLHNKKG